ncbi:MAG: hypothetical protein JXB13_01360 [Phycisphaerae bacterium]|nr:hypothetical protein [Phycisphaerae bacterium]
MKRLIRTAAVVLGVCATPALLLALGADHPKPTGGANWWPAGLKELANRPDRVHGFFVNMEDVFFYAGDTAAFNDFLVAYARLDNTILQLVIHPGPKKARSPWDKEDRDIAVDWMLYAAAFTREQLESGQMSGGKVTTKIDLYLGRGIGLDGLRIPHAIQVSSGGEIEAFLAARAPKPTADPQPEPRVSFSAIYHTILDRCICMVRQASPPLLMSACRQVAPCPTTPSRPPA